MAYQQAPRGERLADLRAAIEGQVQLKRYYLSFSTPEERERQEKEIARLRDNAAKINAQADRIEQACKDWRAGFDAAHARVLELRKELLETENESKLARLEELAAEMEALSAQ